MGRAIIYSQSELDWIEKNKTMIRREAHTKFCKKFKRNDVSLTNYTALCKRNGWFTGRTGQYGKGHVPDNKGKKIPFNENSARHRFKKGHLPHNTKYLGHERLSKDGYWEISVDETNPHTGFKRRYVLKHRYVWEQKNGPLPDSSVLKCIDGNRQNCDPENWTAIPRGVLPRLSGRWCVAYDDAPDELKPTLMLAAKLKHGVKQRRDSK